MSIKKTIPSYTLFWRMTCILMMSMLILNAWQTPQAMALSAEQCNAIEVREYAPPLKGMRSVHRPPYQANKLPFGPPKLEILPIGFTNLWPGAGEVGFYLDGSHGRVEGPGWVAETSLILVNRQGKARRVLRTRTQYVRSGTKLDAIDLGFKVRKLPRLYRVDLKVHDLMGKLIVVYEDYFRVVLRKIDVRLGLDRNVYRAGESVFMRLENYGTVLIGFGLKFGLEIYDGTQWRVTPTGILGWPNVGLGLIAGWTQRCQKFTLPLDLSPGRYRLVKWYRVPWTARTEHPVQTAFDVIL